jgi:hypothetical protein
LSPQEAETGGPRLNRMPQKLIYTSAPRLLQAGRSGFGTVAMSKGISPQLVKSAERCSQFSRERGLPSDRVIFSYRTEKTGEGSWHVLSCIRDAGADYSGRTNHEAQHLIFSEREASELASEQITPAGLMAGSPWHRHDGFCGYLEGAIEYGKHVADASSPYWKAYSISRDPGCRGNLTTAAAMRGGVFVYGNSLEQQNEENAQRVLCLYAESQSVCPNVGWGITFTTYFQPGDEVSDYRWIGVPENSPMVEKLQSLGGRQWITLNDPAPARPAQMAAQAPLGGQSKVSAKAAITGHGDPEGAAPGSGRHIQRPPTGPIRRLDDPKPIPAKRGLFELLKSNAKGLALASALIAAVAASWFLLFPTPPEIEFAQTKFPPYEGKAVQPLIRTVPTGREQEVKVEPLSLTNAGETRVTASIPGKMFGAGRTVSELLLVPHAEATITFDTNSLAQSWQDGDKKIELSVTPSVDPLKPDKPLKDFVRLTFKREGDPEWQESYDKSHNGTYQVRAQINDPDCNYKALAETNLVVSIISRSDELSAEAGKSLSQVDPVPHTQAAQLGPKTTFLIAAGGDILERAIEAGIWESGPSRFTVRNWNEGGEAKSVDQNGKVEGKQEALDKAVFLMKEGELLPLKRVGAEQAGGDTSVYTAEYERSGRKIVLIGLGSSDAEQISQSAVGPYVPEGAWLKSQDGGKHISVECGAGFCAAVSLLPNDSQYILTISTPELGREQLPPSKTLRFDASELLVKLEKRRDLLREEIKTAKDPKNASSAEKVYFESNIPYLVAKLTNAVAQKSAEKTLAASLAEEIKKLPTPQGTQTNRPTEFQVASALYIGALNAAYVNPSIGPRLQLNRDNLTTLADERNPGQKTQPGGDDKNVRSFWLLDPNALKQWMQLQNKVTAAEVIKHSYEWLDRRVRLLQPLKGQSPLHDPGEEALRALRDGFEFCSSSPLAAFKTNVPTNDKSNEEELKNVEAKLDSLRNIGGPKASGSAELKVRFPDGRSFTLLPGIKLAPPMQINR